MTDQKTTDKSVVESLEPESPGEHPTTVAAIGAVSMIAGWILGFTLYQGLYSLTYLGILLLLFSYFYYCVNVYEVSGNYQIVAVIMILLPIFPSILYIGHITSGASIIGSLLGGVLLCWLLIFITHHIKKKLKKHLFHITIKPKSPPSTGYVLLLIFVALIFCAAMISASALFSHQSRYHFDISAEKVNKDIVITVNKGDDLYSLQSFYVVVTSSDGRTVNQSYYRPKLRYQESETEMFFMGGETYQIKNFGTDGKDHIIIIATDIFDDQTKVQDIFI